MSDDDNKAEALALINDLIGSVKKASQVTAAIAKPPPIPTPTLHRSLDTGTKKPPKTTVDRQTAPPPSSTPDAPPIRPASQQDVLSKLTGIRKKQ